MLLESDSWQSCGEFNRMGSCAANRERKVGSDQKQSHYEKESSGLFWSN